MGKTIHIENRDGVLEVLDIQKIQKMTVEATEGLEGVSQSELELDAQLQFIDGMTSKDIQNVLIKTAVDKIDIDAPNWTFVAARLFLQDLYHDVGKIYNTKKGKAYGKIINYLDTGVKYNRITPNLKPKFILDRLDDAIVPKRDYMFTYLGIKTLYDRYILKNQQKEPFELPQFLFMGVAMFVAQNETNVNSIPKDCEEFKIIEKIQNEDFTDIAEGFTKEDIPKLVRTSWAKAFYNMLSSHEVMCATPTLSNARTNRHQLSSCYVGSSPDNIEGIFDGYKEMALLSKYGGGIGWDWNMLRSIGGDIDGHKGAAGGPIPFLKITNDIALAVDQLGTRKGAIAVYVEPWHYDIKDFIDLKKNSGEERRRAHDLFPSLWISDLFMERIMEDGVWTLFDPHEVKDLSTLSGNAFKEKYEEYEEDESLVKETLKAKDLWKKILTSYFESGSPFLCFKDTANRRNPNSHAGFIRSSNLCTEIFQNTEPNKYKIKVEYEPTLDLIEKVKSLSVEESVNVVTDLDSEAEDVELQNRIFGKIEEKEVENKHTQKQSLLDDEFFLYNQGLIDFYNEEDIVVTNDGIEKKAKHITSIDTIGNKKVLATSREKVDGDTAVCNLASVNLSKVNSKEDIERVVPIATRFLDNVIDLNFYPNRKTRMTNFASRAIGLGVMGESQMIAEKQIYWGSKDHLEEINQIMDNISFNVIKSSSDLALEKGVYPNFVGSDWSEGVMPIDTANKEAKLLTDKETTNDWNWLRQKVREDGMRNGYLMAIAPTSSISILVGTTQAIEPVYKRKWFEENLSGLIPVVVPKLSPDTWAYYIPAYEVNQLDIIKAASIRQKWMDQGQSTNIFMSLDKASGKYLHEIYLLAWKLGLKSTYYLRSQSPEAANDVEDRSLECAGCQ